ncbi:MAG TPA: RimK family protein [Ramlibacter sp.]|uniref:RimK family protein n=1 Tax=Ramlibacter sp. TaxID=1917967 RepID=UPI002B92BA02|nr:RimK family protein [Ramlibacter sp.]HVZ45527.1 RimK family protein [Ramlibacter sp.]
MSSVHVIVVEKRSDFRWPDPARRVMTAEEFVSERGEGASRQRKVINLCRSYDYLSMGYYCSLLAEARGERVTPSVETIMDLQQKSSELEPRLAQLGRLIGELPEVPRSVDSLSFHAFFGHIEDPQLAELARRAFELFRCPLLEIRVERLEGATGWRVSHLVPLEPRDVDPSRDAVFLEALDQFTRRAWRPHVVESVPRMDLAILHDPREPLPPSNAAALQNFVRVARSMDVDAELIEKKDFSRLTQFDALLVRETTAVDHHTFRFAKRAATEGMPVIDDPQSILRCTNKAFLAELLQGHGIATPRTRLVSRRSAGKLEHVLSYPVVLKVPDGSFSRSVKKAGSWREFQEIAQAMFKDSGIILVQDFMYTDFDWRVGILAGEPLFVARYFMSRDHWQILRHREDGRHEEGRVEAVSVEDAPRAVIEAAVRSAALVGDGLYGVDLKETPSGVYVIEVNDNPNIDAAMEDAILGDELYARVIGELLRRYESPHERAGAAPAGLRIEPLIGAHVGPHVGPERAQPRAVLR